MMGMSASSVLRDHGSCFSVSASPVEELLEEILKH